MLVSAFEQRPDQHFGSSELGFTSNVWPLINTDKAS
jgi:hypothetical protein